VVLSLLGACLALVLAWIWLARLNAYGIVVLFITGVDPWPDFTVPYRLTPVPLLLGFVISLVIVLTGTVFSSWRAAIVPPRDAMR
jgi:ABC-type lipoprotein release transport system permease subunit